MIAAVGALALGGVLDTTGAMIYASERPDLVPTVSGYHELFYLLVIAAAAPAIWRLAFWVLSGSRCRARRRLGAPVAR